jgi:hypothetical protein
MAPAMLACQVWSWSGWALVAVIAAPMLGRCACHAGASSRQQCAMGCHSVHTRRLSVGGVEMGRGELQRLSH